MAVELMVELRDGARVIGEEPLILPYQPLTVRELITERVRQHLGEDTNVDTEKAVDTALTAFEKRQFFVVVDDRKIDSLDAYVEVAPETHVAFWRLIPLVGG